MLVDCHNNEIAEGLMKGIILRCFQATLALGLGLTLPSQAQFLDGVDEIIVSAPVSNTRKVDICYGEVSNVTRCNYQQAPLSQMTVPFWGQIIYSHRIAASAESRATFFVTNENHHCTLHLTDETFLRNTHIVGNGNILSFDVSQASLGDGTSCFNNSDKLYINADISVFIHNEFGGITPVRVIISNRPGETPGSNNFQLQKTIVKTLEQ